MSKKTYKKVKCDCRNCQRAGPVENFMVVCPKHRYKKSVGVRLCEYFKPKDVRQDNNESDR